MTCIWVGSKVNTIGDRAFRKCKKLEKLYIQSSKLKPEDIGERVFENVPKDLKIYVPEKKKPYIGISLIYGFFLDLM